MPAPSYSYRVDAAGRVRSLIGDDTWQPAGRTRLDGVQRTASWFGPFSRPARDLLRVAAAVLDADRLSPRGLKDAHSSEADLVWQRAIHVRVAVEDPDRWTAAAPALCNLLTFMTDDGWELGFDAAPAVRAQSVLFDSEGRPPSEVALFSGGLDSVAGAYVRSQSTPGAIVAVSACANEVRGKAQAGALASLRALGVDSKWVRLVHQLRGTGRTRHQMESSRRSRGFLFLAMGAAVAAGVHLPTFSAYESGIGCINLPLSPAQIASQGTRAMHPHTLSQVNDLFRLVLDNPVRVIVPFFLQTKGMLCGDTREALAQLALATMSCDEGEGHKPDAMQHCGLCTSCVFRRIAILSAGLQNDPTLYRDRPTRRHGAYELRAFAHHATQLGACTQFSDLVALDPDIRFASEAPLETPLSKDQMEARVFAMYTAYTREIRQFLGKAPTLQLHPKPLRKEKERDLFAAAG